MFKLSHLLCPKKSEFSHKNQHCHFLSLCNGKYLVPRPGTVSSRTVYVLYCTRTYCTEYIGHFHNTNLEEIFFFYSPPGPIGCITLCVQYYVRVRICRPSDSILWGGPGPRSEPGTSMQSLGGDTDH